MKKVLVVFFAFMLVMFSIINVLAVQGADFAIYDGPGTWEPSKTAFKNFLEWKGLTWEEVSKHDINKGRLIGNFQGLFMPGGWAGDYNIHIKPSGDQHIRDFIDQGGAYIGMSAGAFYACDVTIWQGNVYNYPSNIFDGDCIGPIDEIAPWPEYVMTTMDINLGHEANVFEPAQRDVLYFGEPYFVPNSGQEVQTFASWIVPANPIADGKPGIIGFNYGSGRVLLVGPHPEIEEDDARDGTDFADELSDGSDGSDWPFLWTGIDWLLQQPITLPPGSVPPPLAVCEDGLDNDGDGLIDFPADLGCSDALDDDESDPLPPPVTQCNDEIDNDGDGLIDVADPGCLNAEDDDETDPTGPVEVFFDGFEDGQLDGWLLYGPGADWSAKSDVPYEGSWVARAKKTGAQDDSFMETSIDVTGYGSVTFEYYRKLVGLDAADDFEVQYFDNGWVSVEHLGSDSENNNNFLFKSFSIPSSATKIRFKCECGAVSEKCYVDNVRVLGE